MVVGAPRDTSITVEASDTRPALVATRPMAADERLEIDPGFVVITLKSASETRRLQCYVRSGGELRYQWSGGSTRGTRGVAWLDRDAAEKQAQSNFEALMAARRAPAKLEATLASQRDALDNLGDDEHAHLLRLLHASNAIQIAGPDAAWETLAPIPADAIAWAAYSGRLLELRALFGDHGEARRRFSEVRDRVADLGLATAFAAGDLYQAEQSGEQSKISSAYSAAMSAEGPPEIGKPMPPFEFIDLDTRLPVRDIDLLGSPYLLEVWSTWCKPCVEQMTALHELHTEVTAGGSQSLRLVSIAINDTRVPVDAFRKDHWPMPWTNIWVPSGTLIFNAWEFTGVPYAVLVDAKGVVLRAGADVKLEDVRDAATPTGH